MCDRGNQKGGVAAELAKIKSALLRGSPIEVWFQSLSCGAGFLDRMLS